LAGPEGRKRKKVPSEEKVIILGQGEAIFGKKRKKETQERRVISSRGKWAK